jgi:serine/threonine-protein kinase
MSMAGTPASGARLGSYRLESVIGTGPRGVVYRARHVRLDTRAAVKVLTTSGMTPAAAERLQRSLNTVAELEHPNITTVVDADAEGDPPYVVTRLVRGGDLRALITRGGALEPSRAEALLTPVARALDAAHAHGLVHGDVKPSNILVQRAPDGTVAQVQLTDFGMPPLSEETLPTHDAYDYTAPELAEGEAADPRVDVFSLGCVLYHALTGRVPFDLPVYGEAPGIEPPSRVRPGLPAALDAPVLRAIEHDPALRFAACGELMSAVAAVVGRPPSEPAPEPTPAAPPPSEPAPAPAAAAPPPPEPAAVRPPAPAPPPAPSAPSAPPVPQQSAQRAAAPAEPAARRWRPSRTVAVVAGGFVLAAVVGYVASASLGGDDGGDGGQATAATPLGAIVARSVPELRCTVRPAAPGAGPLETAGCVPRSPSAAPIDRLSVTRFSSREGLDALYRTGRSLVPDPAARRRGDCSDGQPWGGRGAWPEAGSGAVDEGRMFCFTRSGRPAIVWTVNDSLVLAEATAANSSDLGAWWARRRQLRR